MKAGIKPRTTEKCVAAFFIAVMIGGAACSSSQERDPNEGIPSDVLSGYNKELEHWTRSDKKYSGIENKFEASATLLSMEVVNSQLALENAHYKWSSEDYAKKRNQALTDSNDQTKVFVSFFTPVDEDNNLDKKNTVWNLFLIVNGQRYSPKTIKRIYGNMSDLKSKYPYHNPWSKPYEVTFPVGTDTSSKSGATLVVAGPVGETLMKFGP